MVPTHELGAMQVVPKMTLEQTVIETELHVPFWQLKRHFEVTPSNCCYTH
jgi:hypothetical protein